MWPEHMPFYPKKGEVMNNIFMAFMAILIGFLLSTAGIYIIFVGLKSLQDDEGDDFDRAAKCQVGVVVGLFLLIVGVALGLMGLTALK